jgi:hypothetical protein
MVLLLVHVPPLVGLLSVLPLPAHSVSVPDIVGVLHGGVFALTDITQQSKNNSNMLGLSKIVWGNKALLEALQTRVFDSLI